MTINEQLIKDDLYQAVNGDWLATAKIPADKPATGGFSLLGDQVEEQILKEAQDLVKDPSALEGDSIMQEFVACYKLALNKEAHQTQGFDLAKSILDSILKVETLDQLSQLLSFLSRHDLSNLITISVDNDMKDAQHYALYLDIPPLILPDTPYYAADHEEGRKLLAIYSKQSKEILTALGYDKEVAEEWVHATLQLEEEFAQYCKNSQELADYTQSYNPQSKEKVKEYFQELDILGFLQNLVGPLPDKIIVTQPRFFSQCSAWFNEDRLKDLKAWLLVRVANNFAEVLSEDLRLIGSQYQLKLTGAEEAMDEDKYIFHMVHNQFNQAFGSYYGKKFFGPQAREDVRQMVDNMINVYQDRLQEHTWLSQDTIRQAIAKLNKMTYLVGYPDDCPEHYQELKVDPEKSFFENFLNLVAVHRKRNLDRLDQKVDRDEWLMPADMVNAYYNPTANNICFPAAILQPPFYSFDQSRAANYGGIGAVIAHEISHAFDNNGAKIDQDGNLNNWWTEEDFAAFDQKAQAMIKQWEGLPFGQGQVNGELTVSENIADCGGLTAALQALKAEDNPDLREFFINWARIWCQKARPEYEAILLNIDVHAPSPLRGNIPVRNFEDFYQVFGIKEGDGMWMDPEDRVIIW